ncbi:hypothetical protein JX266_000565 [Neoarthrinium moseri]|uniref:uncharacterized protein n=1 Tax=Neoarthrinium moseri TaxID=1658444 RepID=UPI001FDCF526|nr:uncharacterized protein JN550_004319 [Neoarthrinium moseri]KAI1855700.1 hypothetical protein JX266_000565 [Neoarthrinium moseri]KAI1872116.1 hypothetical protein JN550_004319 [Neoarthrinium moseri]
MHGLISTLAAILPLAVAAPFGHNARDSNAGCQAKSQKDFQWTVENFDYHASYIFTTPAHQNSWGYVNFNLTNPALEYKASCSASSSQLSDFFYGTMAYNCTVPDGSTTKATFDFNRANGELNINQTWVCSDLEPQWPATFHAYGQVNLTLDCTDSTWQNPNWTIGQIYSDREVKCAPVTVPVKPHTITAVA